MTAPRMVQEPQPEPQGRPSFADLVREHQAMVFSMAWHCLRDRGVAEELAQDVFLQLHQHLDQLESPAHIRHWLRRVTANRCIDVARRARLRPQLPLEEIPEPSETPRPVDPLLRDRLRRLVASLPEKARAVMVLRYQEDLDPGEIAETLGMPVKTVRSHLARSLAMLREKLGRCQGEAKS